MLGIGNAHRPVPALVIALGLVLSACAPPGPAGGPGGGSTGESKGSAPPASEKQLRIIFNNPVFQPGISFLWIGQGLGYFEEEKLTPEFVPSQGAAEATQWVASGKGDVAFPQPGPLVEATGQGQDLGLVAVYLLNRQMIYEFVVNPDSPIKTVADIKGKKVGVVNETDEGIYIHRSLMRELGYEQNANQVIGTGQNLQAAEALKKGTVDVMIWADTQRALSQANGYQWRILPNPPWFDKLFSNVLITRRDFLAKNREVLVSFLRVLAKSSLFFATNSTAALQLHFKLYPQTVPTGKTVDESVKANLISVEVRTPKLLPRSGEKWGEFSKENWEYYVRSYIGVGSDKIKDSSTFFTNELVADINKFDQQKVIDQAKNFK